MKTRTMGIALSVMMLAILGGAMTLRHRSSPNTKLSPAFDPPVASQAKRAIADAQSREFETETLAFERTVVKREPVAATVMIEQFHEGTGEIRTTTAVIYRDQAGRTRRDQMPANSNTPETTTINDPVVGFTYLIQPRDSTARRTRFSSHGTEKSTDAIAAMQNAISNSPRASSYQILPVPMSGPSGKGLKQQAAPAAPTHPQSDPLGQREIEGVETEGTRMTLTIPAGTLGNEREMQIVTERWYAPKLKMVILIERLDPRFGRSVYRLSGVKTADPPATLFRVPENYKITVE